MGADYAVRAGLTDRLATGRIALQSRPRESIH